MGRVPEEPGLAEVIAEQRELLSRLRAVVEAKDTEIALLRRELDAERELRRRLELRVAELERRLSMDSSDSGTPSSKERIGAKEARRARQRSERERSKDRRRGGQPGHQGKGLQRDPDPDERKTADPPAECRSCKTGLDGAEPVEPRWAQVIDAEVIRKVTEWLRSRASGSPHGRLKYIHQQPNVSPRPEIASSTASVLQPASPCTSALSAATVPRITSPSVMITSRP